MSTIIVSCNRDYTNIQTRLENDNNVEIKTTTKNKLEKPIIVNKDVYFCRLLNKQFMKAIFSKPKKEIHIYTDGASNQVNTCGYASIIISDIDVTIDSGGLYMLNNEYIIKSDMKPKPPGDHKCTNNYGELAAIWLGLYRLKQDYYVKNNKIIVYSDSNIYVKTFNEWIHKWIKKGWKKSDGKTPENLLIIQEIWNIIERMKKCKNQVTFVHVKAHNGDTLNEIADYIASYETNNRC